MALLFNYNFSSAQQIIVLEQTNEFISILICPKTKPDAISEIIRSTGLELKIEHADQEEFEQRLSLHFSKDDVDTAKIADEAASNASISDLFSEIPVIQDLLDSNDDAPIIKTINALFAQAVRDKASDIHIEPFEKISLIRFRIDGKLSEIASPNKILHSALVSRIKVMAGLDIAEKRLPQDGRISLRLANKPIDVRISTLPTIYGERVVMRVLHKEESKLSLKQLGMPKYILDELERISKLPHGIVLVTGPTGSGKTTSLYSLLGSIDYSVKNIMTVEDPVEYNLEGISQTSVSTKIDMNFARALRSILRQDPDIVMIGEIRDLETTHIAVQASLTGHLVLATLHTNNSISAVVRLMDMGVEPFLLAPSLRAVLAQRLLRRLCSHCKIKDKISESAAATLSGIPIGSIVCKPSGCSECRNTGYSGRIGVFELFKVTDEIEDLIHSKASQSELELAAIKLGFKNILQESCQLVLNHDTSAEEALNLLSDI